MKTEKKETRSTTSKVLTAADIIKLGIKEVPKLFEPYFQKVGVGILCGGSDAGKSYLCLNLGLAICSGEKTVLGLNIRREHGSAIFMCTEDTQEDLCVRLSALTEKKKFNLESLRFILETDNVTKTLEDELTKKRADLVVIDTFGDVFDGNINQSVEVRKFFMPYKKLASKYQCLILFNHHIGKSKESKDKPDKSDVLGSQGIESACRMVCMLKKNADGTRVFTVVKGNNIADSEKNKGMILDFHPKLGFTPTGKFIDDSTSLDAIQTELEKKVLELYPKLKSHEKVAKALTDDGYKIGRNKSHLIWKKYHPSVPKSTKKDDGQKEKKAA